MIHVHAMQNAHENVLIRYSKLISFGSMEFLAYDVLFSELADFDSGKKEKSV